MTSAIIQQVARIGDPDGASRTSPLGGARGHREALGILRYVHSR